jgi:hypothetical protein
VGATFWNIRLSAIPPQLLMKSKAFISLGASSCFSVVDSLTPSWDTGKYIIRIYAYTHTHTCIIGWESAAKERSNMRNPAQMYYPLQKIYPLPPSWHPDTTCAQRFPLSPPTQPQTPMRHLDGRFHLSLRDFYFRCCTDPVCSLSLFHFHPGLKYDVLFVGVSIDEVRSGRGYNKARLEDESQKAR